MNIKELKMNLEKEFIVEKIYDILNSKSVIKFPLSLQELSELYDNSIYIDKTKYDEQVNMDIYDKDGFELLNISPPFINEYSQEDFFIDLQKAIKKILEMEF